MAGDALRAMHLEMNGYSTDIIEYVSSRYTDKNIMLAGTSGKFFPPEALLKNI